VCQWPDSKDLLNTKYVVFWFRCETS